MARPRKAPASFRPWQRADVALLRRFAPTHSAAEIAKMLGRTPEAVHGAALLLGVSVGRPGAPPKYDDDTAREAMRRYFRDGETVTRISREMSIPRSTISRWIHGQRCRHIYREFVGQSR